MNGMLAALRMIRKPALALMAVAGVVVWGGVGAAPVPVMHTSSGDASVVAAPYLQPVAIPQTGFATTILAAGKTAGGSNGSSTGDTPPQRHPIVDPGSASLLRPLAPPRSAEPAPASTRALSRAGRDSAPSTAPPSLSA